MSKLFKYSAISLAMLVCTLLLCACPNPIDYNSPRHYTNAFSPEQIAPRRAVAYGEGYLYYDHAGAEGSGIYRVDTELNVSFVFKTKEVHSLKQNGEWLYFLALPHIDNRRKIIGVNIETGDLTTIEECYIAENSGTLSLQGDYDSCYYFKSGEDYFSFDVKTASIEKLPSYPPYESDIDPLTIALKRVEFPELYKYSQEYGGGSEAAFAAEDDNGIIVLLQKAKKKGESPFGVVNLPQSMRDTDAIALVNPATLKYEFLYETKGHDRIVGYLEGKVYLFSDGTVSAYNIASGDSAEVAANLHAKEYSFEMCGEKLFVWDASGKCVGIYDV
jgi:hypothetical protein